MIVTKDIEKIVVKDLSDMFPVQKIYCTDDVPDGKVTEERITVHVKRISIATYFNRNFVEVNWCVPDLCGRPDSVRLGEAEHQLSSFEATGEYDDTPYRYGTESMEIVKSELGCHYVNLRLLFEQLNVV